MNYQDIDAFFPFYNEETNTHTCLLFNDGTRKYIKPRVPTYIPNLFFESGLNPKSVHNWSSQLLKSQTNLPILINDKLIFIPVKFHTNPYAPGQSHTFGYINFHAIAFYSDREVMLKNQTILQTLSPRKFIEKKMRDAMFLSYAYNYKRKELGLPLS